MTRSSHQGQLLYFPEIEARYRRLNALRRRRATARALIREQKRRDNMAGTVQQQGDNQFQPPPPDKMLRDYFVPYDEDTGSPLVYPEVEAENFELRSNMIQWVQQACSFHGLPNEDPNDHIRTFIRVCNTIKIRGLSADDIKLRIFLFTLVDEA